MAICNKLFDALFLPISLYSFEVWGSYDRTDAKKWEKNPRKKFTHNFTNILLAKIIEQQILYLVVKQEDYYLNLTLI